MRLSNGMIAVRSCSVSVLVYLFAMYIDDVGKNFYLNKNSFILLYADDILLITPSVAALQKLLLVCETELNYLDMTINTKKSSCIRVGPIHDKTCANIYIFTFIRQKRQHSMKSEIDQQLRKKKREITHNHCDILHESKRFQHKIANICC